MKRSKIYLPKTFEELSSIPKQKLDLLWIRYFGQETFIQKPTMLRPLWYKIQCENFNTSLHQKIITKLNKYSKDPINCLKKSIKKKYNLTPGVELTKKYKGTIHQVLVLNDGYKYNSKHYKNLSAIGKEITGMKVSGNNFFGLTNKVKFNEKG